jgi:uncharacterized OsmC-like protein
MAGVLKSAVGKRASGDRPSPLHAMVAALAAGAAAAVVTYRLIRSS